MSLSGARGGVEVIDITQSDDDDAGGAGPFTVSRDVRTADVPRRGDDRDGHVAALTVERPTTGSTISIARQGWCKDVGYSSLHTVGKLLSAKLGELELSDVYR